MPSLVLNVCKNALAPYLGARALRRGCCGIDSSLPAVLRTLDRVAELLVDAGVARRAPRVLEIGPGRTPELLVAMVLLGTDHGIGLDVDLQVPTDATSASRYEELVEALCAPERSRLLECFGMTPCEVYERFEHLQASSLPVTFQAYDGVNLPLADEKVDLVLTKSVLEHVRMEQVNPLLREMRRVLATDGAMVHQVDLRDHLHIDGDDRVHGNWLEALTLSSRRFEIMFSRRSTRINRLRSCQWRDALDATALAAVSWHERRFPLPDAFDPRALQRPWSGFSTAELAIGQIDFVACRTSRDS